MEDFQILKGIQKHVWTNFSYFFYWSFFFAILFKGQVEKFSKENNSYTAGLKQI